MIIHALKKWHHYLFGDMFEVWMEHESLKWLSSQKGLIGRKAHWVQIQQEFDLQICYQKGRYNIVANALSCMLMVNELSFTRFKSILLESLKGSCKHDTSFVEVWWSVCTQNKTV